MKRTTIIYSLLLMVCSLALDAQTPAAKQPIGAGWWKLNLEKSTYKPGPKPVSPVSQMRQYALRRDGFWVVSIFGVNQVGRPTFTQTVFKLDGQERQSTFSSDTLAEFQATGTRPPVRSIQKAIDEYTVEITNIGLDGTPVATITRAVAKDGKTFTLTTKAATPQGQVINVELFDHVEN